MGRWGDTPLSAPQGQRCQGRTAGQPDKIGQNRDGHGDRPADPDLRKNAGVLPRARQVGWSATALQLLPTGHQPDKTRPCRADPEGGLTGEGIPETTEKSQPGLASKERAQGLDRPRQGPKRPKKPDKTGQNPGRGAS